MRGLPRHDELQWERLHFLDEDDLFIYRVVVLCEKYGDGHLGLVEAYILTSSVFTRTTPDEKSHKAITIRGLSGDRYTYRLDELGIGSSDSGRFALIDEADAKKCGAPMMILKQIDSLKRSRKSEYREPIAIVAFGRQASDAVGA